MHIICAHLPRLIRGLITYKTDPKCFCNSSLAILCTLKLFWGLNKFLGPPGGPLEVEGPKNEIFSKIGKSTLSAFWLYLLAENGSNTYLAPTIHDGHFKKMFRSLDTRVPMLWSSAKFGSKKQKMRKIVFRGP
jgi:hypothetical protein